MHSAQDFFFSSHRDPLPQMAHPEQWLDMSQENLPAIYMASDLQLLLHRARVLKHPGVCC